MTSVPFADVAVLPAAGDNAAVAVRRIDPGTAVETPGGVLSVRHTVPEGHRFAVRPVAAGEPFLSWGSPFGAATRATAAGEYVVSERMLGVLRDRSVPFALPEPNLVDRALPPYLLDERTFRPGRQVAPAEERRTFRGYHRGHGLGVGTRNHVVLVATSSRAGAFVHALGRRLADVGRDTEGLDPVVTVVHTEGGRRRWAHNRELVLRTLAGYAVHPNVGAMLTVDEPGSPLGNADLVEYLRRHDYPVTGRPLEHLTRQAGVEEDLARAERMVRSWLPGVVAERTEQPLSALSVALQCGGSDAFSGITANPLAGAVARELVRHGGSAVLAETDELIGAEGYVLDNVRDLETARRFLAAVERFQEQVRRHGHTAETNVSGGNLWRGLYNITIKSLGAARKRDPLVRLDHVLDYGERFTGSGYVFMDSPGNDLESIAGEVATGANLVFFTTGNGSVTNFPFVPTLKIVSTSGRFRLLPAEMDVDAGALLTGTPSDVLTREVLDLAVAVASGRASAGERAGHSQVSLWRDWERGPDAPVAEPGEGERLDAAPAGAPVALDERAEDPELTSLLRAVRVPRDVELVMPTSICSGQVAQQIAGRLQSVVADRVPGRPPRFAAPAHTEGCGVSSGASERLFSRVVVGHLRHPRVRDALLLEHGCEKTHNDYFRARITEAGADPESFGWASIQLDGGIAAVGEKVERWFVQRAVQPAGDTAATAQHAGTPPPPAETVPSRAADHAMVLGLHAVGPVPDAAAAPLARLARATVDAGGTVLLMEGTPLTENPGFRDVLGLPDRPPVTLRHGDAPTRPGLHVVAGPGEDWLEACVALVSGAAGVVLVHVAGATLPGHPFVPVVQVSADPGTARRAGEDLDATLATDHDPRALAELVVAAAEGRYEPRADRSGLVGFQVSRGMLGVSM